MAILFSRSAEFFDTDFHSTYPRDCVEITKEWRDKLLRGRGNGATIAVDDDGYPILVDYIPPSISELNAVELANRLVESNQKISTIKPAVDGGYATEDDIAALPLWQRYRYGLTQVDKQPGWPESPQWPEKP